MKNKLIGVLIGIGVVVGGAFAVTAVFGSDNNQIDDQKAAPVSGEVVENVEMETENGETSFKVERDDSVVIPADVAAKAMSVEEAAKIAIGKVKGKVVKVEKEMEHGRLEYKFEIKTSSGESDVRVDAISGEITRVDHDGKKKGKGGSGDDLNDDKGGDSSGNDDTERERHG